MDYKEVQETIDGILDALKKGDYEVSYGDPNFIRECTAPEGRTFYKIVDMDDIKTSNDFGSCTVYVSDYEFSCYWGTGEYESRFFDDIEEEYELEDGTCVFKDDLIECVIDAFNDRNDIFFGEYTDKDWLMELYAKKYGIKNIEYYWCEDDDCPVDINDGWTKYTVPKDLGYGIVYYKRLKYYLVEKPGNEDGERLHAVHCHTKPDDHGRFETVIFEVCYKENGRITVTSCEEADECYDAAAGWIE